MKEEEYRMATNVICPQSGMQVLNVTQAHQKFACPSVFTAIEVHHEEESY